MVGLAYTVRYIPAREDLNSIDVFKNTNHPQRVAIEECPMTMSWFLIVEKIQEQHLQVLF